MLELETKPLLKLSKITSLLDALHENSILYCHWKSNEHLAASMTGDTDLDVLFDISQKEKVEAILAELGYKRFNAIKQKQYKDITDFIALDFESGKLIHLHTHYRLTVGEPYLKGYHLEVEEHVLNSRVFNEDYGIYCIQPAFELILLYIRESLKLRNRDLLLMYLKNKIQCNEHALREYHWIKSRTSKEEIFQIVKSIFTNYLPIYNIIIGDFNRKELYKLALIIKNEISLKKLYAPLSALILRWYREATIIISRKLAHITNRPILLKRINPRGGIVIAVVGVDGSGKSTVTTQLNSTFEHKLDVFKIYFGRGVGDISFSRKLLLSAKKSIKPRVNSNGHDRRRENNISLSKGGLLKSLYKSFEAMLVAWEKYNNIDRMLNAKRKGALVICDRYPQNQVMGLNDGPLLYHFLNSRNPLLRAAAKLESKVYARAERHAPDILFKLEADVEVVERRKPGETPTEKLIAKINGLKQLTLNSHCKVVSVDVTKPLHEVLYIIKREIWNSL